MLKLSLLIAGAVAFNFGGYNATKSSVNSLAALESVHWVGDLEINLAHYTYPEHYNREARTMEQWIIRNVNDTLLAVSDIRSYTKNETYAKNVFDDFNWRAVYSFDGLISLHQIQQLAYNHTMNITSTVVDKEGPMSLRQFERKHFQWAAQGDTKYGNFELSNGRLNHTDYGEVRRPFISGMSLSETKFTANTLSNRASISTCISTDTCIWYPSGPMFRESTPAKQCDILKVAYFATKSEIAFAYLTRSIDSSWPNETFWSCSLGDKTFTFREKHGTSTPMNPVMPTSGTWILTDASIDANASFYNVYSVTFGELGDFQNQFQLCDDESCANPARWKMSDKSTEHRMLPMHHLRPQCMDFGDVKMNTCSGVVSKLPDVLYWGQFEFKLEKDVYKSIQSSHIISKQSNTWQLRLGKVLLAESKRLLVDWYGVCDEPDECGPNDNYPMNSPMLTQPGPCPKQCSAYPFVREPKEKSLFKSYEMILDDNTKANYATDLDFLYCGINVTGDGKFEFKTDDKKVSDPAVLFTPLFDAACPSDIKYLLARTSDSLRSVNPARLCQDRHNLHVDYAVDGAGSKRSVNRGRFIDIINVDCASGLSRTVSNCHRIIVPLSPAEHADVVIMVLNMTSGLYHNESYTFGVEIEDKNMYWLLKLGTTFLAKASGPFGCPDKADLVFMRKSGNKNFGVSQLTVEYTEELSYTKISCYNEFTRSPLQATLIGHKLYMIVAAISILLVLSGTR